MLEKLGDMQKSTDAMSERNEMLERAMRDANSEKVFLANELERWKEVVSVTKTELEKEDKEVRALDERVVNLTENLRLANEFKEKQAELIDSLKDEIQKVRLCMNSNGSMKAGNEIMLLRKELETTVNEWGEAEKKRRDREDRLVELKASLVNEQEKNGLLVTQLKLVEDQLSLAREELAVYSQIDIYESSVKKSFAFHSSSRKASSSTVGKRRHRDTSFYPGSNVSVVSIASPTRQATPQKKMIDNVDATISSPLSLVETFEEGEERRAAIGSPDAIRSRLLHDPHSYSDDDDDDDDDMLLNEGVFSKAQLAQAKKLLMERQKRAKWTK